MSVMQLCVNNKKRERRKIEREKGRERVLKIVGFQAKSEVKQMVDLSHALGQSSGPCRTLAWGILGQLSGQSKLNKSQH